VPKPDVTDGEVVSIAGNAKQQTKKTHSYAHRRVWVAMRPGLSKMSPDVYVGKRDYRFLTLDCNGADGDPGDHGRWITAQKRVRSGCHQKERRHRIRSAQARWSAAQQR